MKGGRAVSASLVTVVALVGVAGLVRLAGAAPPAGFKCGKGGKKNVAKERCDCPAGKRPSRDGDDQAVCTPKRRIDSPLPTCPSDMVLVPGGTFQMGSPDGVGDSDEHPQHRVTLSPYCIDRTEVTVAAYEACGTCTSAAEVADWSSLDDITRKLWNDCNRNRADRQDHPANCITWNQAETYCAAAGKQLPTEAQWELAARGTDGRSYPWGNKAPSAKRLNACGFECRVNGNHDVGNDGAVMYEDDDGHATTAPVGTYPDGASPYGALDMAGNVWEWVADEYGPYDALSAKDPAPAATTAAAAHKAYLLRGGGWGDLDPSHVRAAHRTRGGPSARGVDNGFRCARGVP